MREPSRAPIAVSAFVCPGVGQMMQRRWVAGAVYLVAFLAVVVLALRYVVKAMSAWYGLVALDGSDAAGGGAIMPSAARAVLLLLAAVVIQVVCAIDAWLAYLRRRREWALRIACDTAGAARGPASTS